MDKLNINSLLNRNDIINEITNKLIEFENSKHDLTITRGFYIYGYPGSGKSYIVKEILELLGYDIIIYDASDIRNKSVIDLITTHNISENNVISLFKKKKQKIAIFMDEIDGMNSGDKGGISELIKLIRPKKTKKQKKEITTMIPIVCAGNYHLDKKTKELMKVCNTYELKTPTNSQVQTIINLLMPNLDTNIKINLINYIHGDLRKINSSYEIYKKQEELLKNELLQNILQGKVNNEYTKDITKYLINNQVSIKDHNIIMNETDRTTVSLLVHENIIDMLQNKDISTKINKYLDILDIFTYCDYLDRITFQKQIWIFNELSSILKTIQTNYEYNRVKTTIFQPKEVRFTKILTKYSTEYNNKMFIQSLCQKLNMDKKDVLSYFHYLQKNESLETIIDMFQNLEISKLDIQRIFRFMDTLQNIDNTL